MEDMQNDPQTRQKLEQFAKSVGDEEVSTAAGTLDQSQAIVDTLNMHLTNALESGSFKAADMVELAQVVSALGVLVPKVPGLSAALVQTEQRPEGLSGIKNLGAMLAGMDKDFKEKGDKAAIAVSLEKEGQMVDLKSGSDVEMKAHKELNSLLSNFKVSVDRLANNDIITETLIEIGLQEADIGSRSVDLLPLAVEAIKTDGKVTLQTLEKSGVPEHIIAAIRTFKDSMAALNNKRNTQFKDFVIFDAIAADMNLVEKRREPTETEIRKALKTLTRINPDKYVSNSITM